jgi:hypothetical protein
MRDIGGCRHEAGRDSLVRVLYSPGTVLICLLSRGAGPAGDPSCSPDGARALLFSLARLCGETAFAGAVPPDRLEIPSGNSASLSCVHGQGELRIFPDKRAASPAPQDFSRLVACCMVSFGIMGRKSGLGRQLGPGAAPSCPVRARLPTAPGIGRDGRVAAVAFHRPCRRRPHQPRPGDDGTGCKAFGACEATWSF